MNEKNAEERINEFIDAVMRVARGDYSVQLNLSEEYNYLDALAIGINMMVDDVRKSHETELENDRITLLNSELREAKEKAEQSDRLKSAFLANMSHEIRTPMNGILGFANLLKEPSLSDEDQRNYLDILEKSGIRLLNIINDLIDISKIESGQMNVTISATNIKEQTEYIYEFFKPEVEMKGMKLIWTKSISGNDILNTDPEKVYAILTNLVKNAIKYSDKGSIEIGYTIKDHHIEFFVKDTGIGIPEDKLEIIFDRFVQTNNSLSRSFEGVGLGLAICKAYVEMLGGKIWVESQEGKGSIFYFTLPIISKKEETVTITNIQNKTRETEKAKNLKVLIVEDDQASEMLLAIAIRKFSRETIIVRNGADAVKAIRKNADIDLILMDFMLPGINGYEATRQIREFNREVIIIAQTACGMAEDRNKALEAGCDDYIAKPINKADLNEIINNHFQN